MLKDFRELYVKRDRLGTLDYSSALDVIEDEVGNWCSLEVFLDDVIKMNDALLRKNLVKSFVINKVLEYDNPYDEGACVDKYIESNGHKYYCFELFNDGYDRECVQRKDSECTCRALMFVVSKSDIDDYSTIKNCLAWAKDYRKNDWPEISSSDIESLEPECFEEDGVTLKDSYLDSFADLDAVIITDAETFRFYAYDYDRNRFEDMPYLKMDILSCDMYDFAELCCYSFDGMMDIKKNRSVRSFVEDEISTALFDLGSKMLSLRSLFSEPMVRNSIENSCFKLPDYMRVELSKAVANSCMNLSFEDMYDTNKGFFETLYVLMNMGNIDR